MENWFLSQGQTVPEKLLSLWMLSHILLMELQPMGKGVTMLSMKGLVRIVIPGMNLQSGKIGIALIDMLNTTNIKILLFFQRMAKKESRKGTER